MKTTIKIKGHLGILNKFSCTKCHKLAYQIFHIKFRINKRFISTWLCLDCFNEIFNYWNK